MRASVPLVLHRSKVAAFAADVKATKAIKLPQFVDVFAIIESYETKLMLKQFVIVMVHVAEFVKEV